MVFFGSDDKAIYALNATTGAYIWKMHNRRASRGIPTVSNGILYAGSNDGKLYAFNDSLGMPIWNFPTGGYVTFWSCSIKRHSVFRFL